ncbi:MAG: AIPR family protein [Acidobacteriia bacterium]|nr:AIPR family protein [Terriglobia bacterium]
MDRITKSLLDEFSKEQDIMTLAEDKRFEHFSCYLTVGRFLLEAFDTADIVTGSGGDTGIDGIAIIVNGSLISDADLIEDYAERNGYLDVDFIFVQAERSSAFDSAKIGQFEFGVQDFFEEKPKLPRNAAVKSAASIMAAAYTRSSKFKRRNPTCKLYYVTTGRWIGDAALEARRKTVVADLKSLGLFGEVEFLPIDADSIQRLYRDSKNSVTREFEFPQRTVVPDIEQVSEAYLGLLPASEFLRLIEDEDGDILKSIFYDNVRDWQEYNPVNTEMRDTLVSGELRSRFALMNNGVTIIAKTLRTTGNRFHIEDYQIVNGCQTSHVLHEQKAYIDKSVMVPLRLISTKNDDVIGSIIKATNRQTEVKEEQLLAISDFQKKIEAYFQAFEEGKRLFYERRSRQYNSSAGFEKTRIVTPGGLIRSFASIFLEEPHRTTRSYRAILERVGKSIFAANDRLEPYYVSALALYRLEFLFRNQQLDSKFKPARFQILLAFRLLSSSALLPRMNSHEMERYCDELMKVLWDQRKSLKVFQEAAEAIRLVSGSKLDSDFLRTQPFTESLRNYCAQKNPPKGKATK